MGDRTPEQIASNWNQVCMALRERTESEAASNVTVHEMDAQALDLPDDDFDATISSFGVMICPDRTKAFGEMARVTRPGGRLATSCWQAPPNNEWLQTFMTTVTTALPDADPPTPPPFMELADPDRFRSELETAGWSDVDVVEVTHQKPLCVKTPVSGASKQALSRWAYGCWWPGCDFVRRAGVQDASRPRWTTETFLSVHPGR